nr:hypothetical protein [Tanacetum cinerariifolium]
MSLTKDTVMKVPVLVKMHRVPIVAYYEDGFSLIALQIGKPIMLDAFSSEMCADLLGRLGFAHDLIEVSADNELKKEVIMALPNEDGTGHTKECIRIEYEWKPPSCLDCHVFGHSHEQCPKRVTQAPKPKESKEVEDNNDGFTTVRHKKGKNQAQGPSKQSDGLKMNKQKVKFVWQKVNQNSQKSDKDASVMEYTNPVKLKNNFELL